MLKRAEQRLGLSYMENPRHSTEFNCDCQLKWHAAEAHATANGGASLEADLGLALQRWLEVKLWRSGEPRVAAPVTVSDAFRAVKVHLSVNYFDDVPRGGAA
jgi:hypothetical protein